MEKFTLGNSGFDPAIRTANDANVARFVHLNKMVEDYQKFTTIISAEQAATLFTSPVELNVPEGMYTLAGGYVYYSANATTPLELGGQQIVTVNQTMVIGKNQNNSMRPGEILLLGVDSSLNSTAVSGKVFFSTTDDAVTPPDGNVEITVYLTKLNLTIK